MASSIVRNARRVLGRLRAACRQRVRPLETLPDAPDLFNCFRYLLRAPGLERRPGGWQYEGKFWPDYLTVGGASFAIHRRALQYCKGKGIDVGAGLWPLPGADAVDTGRGPGTTRKIEDIPENSLDYIFSSHCLEHIQEWQTTIRNWVGKLREGGTLFLYLPHPECAIWKRGSPFVGDGHVWTPTPALVKGAVERAGCRVIDADDGPDAMWSFFVCARREGGTRPEPELAHA